MSVLVTPTLRASRSLRAGLTLLLSLSFVVQLAPTQAGAEGDGGISVAVSGLDSVIAGSATPVDVIVRVAERGDLRDDTPLRLIGTLTAEGAPAAGAAVGLRRADRTVDALDIDGTGRFAFPREDRAPLTLASTPALESPGGHTVTLELTVPEEADYTLSVALVVSNERSATVLRRFGADRVATAVDISTHTFNPGVDVAYVARADDFPDALAAGPVAGLGGRPILLSRTTELPAATAAELVRLRPGRIAVLGGPAAISDAVVEQLQALTVGSVTRMAGADRYATAAAIALDRFDGPIDTVFVATGTVFADALAGGPAAALHEAPVLLVDPDAIPEDTARALTALDPRRIVVFGGSTAVSDAVVGRLGDYARDGVTRYFGSTRYETAAVISTRAFEPADVHTVYLATGDKFPDALAGTPAAVLDGAPLMLVTTDRIPDAAKDEIARLGPGVIVLLGGTAVVGEAVADAAVLLTRDIAPDRDRFTELATTGVLPFTAGPELGIFAPTADAPLQLRPRDRFTITFATPHTGSYRLGYRPADASGWQPFENITAAGAAAGGMQETRVNAPLEEGAFDLRLTYTSAGGSSRDVVVEDALQVALTFPPPLISSLLEGVDDQAQLVAVRPVGGLEAGTVLEIRLASAERAGADYPLAPDALTLLGGTGSAELLVGRDQEAMIRYVAGPGDRVPDGGPTAHPLLTFRIDGIDVEEVHEAHVGQFFRYDIMHGVQRIFSIGDGAQIASPDVTDVELGSPHTFQLVRFAVGTAIDPFETVTIDLSEAERAGVDYSEAFAFVTGGGGHDEVEPPHEEPPGLGEVFLDVDPGRSAVLTFEAGVDGVPSVQPEGPTVEIFVGGIAVTSEAVSPPVEFIRNDTGASAATSFAVRPMGFSAATASSLPRDASNLQQTFSATLYGQIDAGHTIYLDLSRAQRRGVDYTNADITVLAGSGTAEWDEQDLEWDPDSARVAYTAGYNDGDGSTISLRLTGVATPDEDRSELARFSRSDSWAQTTAIFDVGAGSPVVGPYVSDLAAGVSDEYQNLAFALATDLPEGNTVTIDLSDAEAGAVSYAGATAYGYVQVEGSWAPADVALDVTDGTAAQVTYTAGPGGLAAGAEVEVFLEGVDVDDVETSYDASFARDGAAQTATARFAIRRMPGVTEVTVSSLLSGTNNQTQTLEARLVTDLPEGDILEIDLSGAEAGAGRYGGAAVAVTQGSGTAQLEAFTGYYAAVRYQAGPTDNDGDTIRLELSGINTDVGHETHAADFYRWDSWRSSTALFDIGDGSDWVGQPSVSSLQAGSPWEWQGVTFRLAHALAVGEQVTVDLSSAESGGVSYQDATDLIWTSTGGATLDVTPGTSATLTFTAGSGGVSAGRTVWIDIEGVATDDVDEQHDVVFTDIPTGAVTTATFSVKQWDGHGFEATATDQEMQALTGQSNRAPSQKPSSSAR